MNVAVITVGMPGSGKTTFARQFLALNSRAVMVSKDEIRKSLYGSKKRFWNNPHHKDQLIRNIAYDTAERVSIDHDICICNTNYTWSAVEPYIQKIQHNCRIYVKHFDVPWEELVRRNRFRPNDDRIDMRYLTDTWNEYQAASPWWREWPEWGDTYARLACISAGPAVNGVRQSNSA